MCREPASGWHPPTNEEHERQSTLEFLIEIEVRLPPTLSFEERAHLFEAERARGRELADKGTIRAIWRVPGRFANRTIWSAPDATALHAAIASLPFFQYLDVEVTPLATHDLGEFCPGFAPGLVVDWQP